MTNLTKTKFVKRYPRAIIKRNRSFALVHLHILDTPSAQPSFANHVAYTRAKDLPGLYDMAAHAIEGRRSEPS